VKRKSFPIALLSLMLFSSVVFAAGGEGHAVDHGHGPVEIPWNHILIQVANLGGLLIFLAWVLRKTVSQYFSERRQVYLDLVQKADAAKLQAEQSRRDIASRLENLEATTKQSLQQAKAEATELRSRIVNEAKELAEKLREESDRSAKLEVEKAKNELRTEMLAKAVEAARAALKEKVGGPEQKKLQSEFVEKIQVVQ